MLLVMVELVVAKLQVVSMGSMPTKKLSQHLPHRQIK